jgi:hypothetical protein
VKTLSRQDTFRSRINLCGKLAEADRNRGGTVSVDKILAQDRKLRAHATARPWHQSGQGVRLRLVGPLPRSTVVVDPYAPNPQDAPLLLHRINTYEELEREIERLRAALRDARARLDSTKALSTSLPTEQVFESLTSDLETRINAALGDRRVGVEMASGGESERG